MGQSSQSASPKPRRWLRWLALGAGTVVVLLVVTYFVVTSTGFFKGVVLPKVSAAMNAQVTVSDARISPFSQVTLKDLKVVTSGTEPLVTASEVRARYSLWDIIGGNIKVAEVALVAPTVTLIENADGTSNLDPITKSQKPGPPAEKKPAPDSGKPGASVHLDLAKFALTDATMRMIKNHPGGKRDLTELSKVNISLDGLKNGQTGKLALAADIALDQNPPAPGTNATLQARFDSSFELGIGDDLNPSGIKGGLRLSVAKAGGALAPLANSSLAMDTEVATDLGQQSAVLKTFALTGSLNQRPLLLANLSSPFTMSWGKSAAAVGDAKLDLTLTNLNLADWKSFAPDFDASGSANATLKIMSRQSGKQIGLEIAARLENLGAKLDSNRLDGINVTLEANGETTEFKQCRFANRLGIARGGESLANVSGAGVADLEKKTADLQVTAEAFLERLLALFPQPGVNLVSGRLKLDAKISQGAASQAVAGSLDLATLTGAYGTQRFTNLSVGTIYDVTLKQPQAIDLRRLQVTLAPTSRAQTNAVSLNGQIDLSKTNALEGALKLTADTLDVTPYYDLVANQPKPEAKSAPQTKPESQPTPPGGSTGEPAPVQLPVKLLTFDVNLNRCFLREIDLSNVVATARIEGSQVTLNPVQFALNGRPASADVSANLGVPGFQYVVNFNADRLPLEPIANSFSPEYRGRAKGEMLANIQLKGAGVTGPSLRKNLSGNLGLNFTNADIQIVGPRLKGFLTPIAAALNAPGLLNSPLHWAGFDAKVGEGKIGFSQLALVSPAFAAATKGEIPMADDLMKSRLQNWPMNFQLDRALAEKLRLAPRDTPTNAAHVALPDFIKVAGTAGEPKPELDLKVLAGAALMKYVDKIPGVDEKTSQLLKGVGAKLSGQSGGATNATTNAPAASKLFDALKNLKK